MLLWLHRRPLRGPLDRRFFRVVHASHSLLQLLRELVVALLARWPQVELEELRLLVHLLVAEGAGEVMNAPRLVQRREHVSGDNLIANEAKIPEQLMIMGFAVGEALLLVMTMTEEWLFAFGAHEVLYVPVFPQCRYDSFFDRPTTSAADRDAHFVVAPQAVQFVQFVGCVSRSRAYFARVRIQLYTAGSAIEMIRMVHFSAES